MALYPGSQNSGLPGWGFVLLAILTLGVIALLPSPSLGVPDEDEDGDA